MEILTTHVGADLDAFAAVYAARRLHPGAKVLFPGSKDEPVRRLLASGLVELPEVKAREVDPAELDRVILCDVRERDRIGVVAEWLEARPEVGVWAYDHHPPGESDLEIAGGVVDPEAGSTATLLTELFDERDMPPTPAEATVLLLGLYEDTGSLTYSSAGPRDLRAAARLLEHGADLALVRRYALPRLDPERLAILHRMTEALEVHRLEGHRVGLVALELGEFVDELAPLVSRCLESFELPLLFALFGEGDRVTVIARGDLPGVHLGRLLDEFADGGGHQTAASARLKEATPLEVRERLLAFLAPRLPPSARAADLMVRRFHTVAAGASVAEAKAGLVERRVNAAPVVDPDGRVRGVVTRQVLDGALQHGLAERPVAAVADTDLAWVASDAPADEVGERMVSRHPRLVLVGDAASGRAEGLVTRMQVLRHLHGRLTAAGTGAERRLAHLPEERAPVADLLAERLPPKVLGLVETAAELSRREGVPVYLVGGLVRDLLLDRENRDLDLVVEGDGPHFARRLAEEVGGRVRVHEAFLTAVVVDPDEFHVDVATARSEFYRAPAALPEVETSPLRQDLYRRDFTINTLAVRLGPEPRPELIDYFGGRRDLEQGILRVLHSLSFIDDPTRVLRAVRLALRLGFRISPETLHLVSVALAEGVFDRLSGARLRVELVLLLDDPALAVRGIEWLEELELLAALHPELALERDDRRRLRRATAAWDWYVMQGLDDPPARLWRLMLLALAAALPELDGRSGGEALADRLMLAGEHHRLLAGATERTRAARAVLAGDRPAPHRVAEALDPLAGEEVLLLMADDDERVHAWARRYLTELRRLEPEVRGRDLVAHGVASGPAIGEALAAVRRARLDGEIGPDEELGLALRAAAAAAGADEANGTDRPAERRPATAGEGR